MQYKFQVQFETAILKLGFRDYNYTCSFAIRTTIVVGANMNLLKKDFQYESFYHTQETVLFVH